MDTTLGTTMSIPMLSRLIIASCIFGLIGTAIVSQSEEAKDPVTTMTIVMPWELRATDDKGVKYVLGRGSTCAEAQLDGASGNKVWPASVKEAKCYKVRRR